MPARAESIPAATSRDPSRVNRSQLHWGTPRAYGNAIGLPTAAPVRALRSSIPPQPQAAMRDASGLKAM